jgi:hypothetical protein
MSSPVICLVTIHGIAFEQPPLSRVPGYPDTAGYADDLRRSSSQARETWAKWANLRTKRLAPDILQ